MMAELFLYNSGTAGDVVFSRPVIRAAVATGASVSVGVCRDHADLVSDLEGVTVRVSDFVSSRSGSPLDLRYLCPGDAKPIDLWLQGYEDTIEQQWENYVEVFNRGAARAGAEVRLEFDEDRIPMIDFGIDSNPEVPERAILVDNARTATRYCHFLFDLERMADALPDHRFLCTAPPRVDRPNVFDVSNLDRVARSAVSNRCELLLGITWDPFNCTLTEANRFKPKAVCGYDARQGTTFWDYPENPLEYLADMDGVLDFLNSMLWEEVHR